MSALFPLLVAALPLRPWAGCPFLESLGPRSLGHRELLTAQVIGSGENPSSFAPLCRKTNGADAAPTAESVCSAYSSVSSAFLASIPPTRRGAASLFGKAARLPFHDAGEFDRNANDALGPDGCLSFSPANAGLIEADSIVSTVFEPMWQNVCDKISRADFWAMLGKIVFEYSQYADQFGFETVETPFSFGRKDSKECGAGKGRLPSAQGADLEIIRVFVSQMGLNYSDAVTLIGAHTLGHVYQSNSGYGLSPDPTLNFTSNAFDLTPDVFDNSYYQALIGVV